MSATADGSISKSDLALYRKLREAVESALRKNGSQFFTGRPESGLEAAGGLLNQGATCYLNSMVQAMFHATPFRQMLYKWTYDEKAHGSAEQCIPLQLQRLFARLQLSQRAAASTQALTRSFGWTAADAFQQHDAQEFLHVLMEALDTTAGKDEARDRAESGDGTKSATSPLRLACECLRGKMRDTVQCCICGFKRVREDPVLDVELTVSGNSSVEQAVRQFHAAELLTGDNRWHCDRCGCRRDATKSITLSQTPPVLLLHLKRFGFDMATMRRAKIQDAFAFPAELHLGSIVEPAVAERTAMLDMPATAAKNEFAQRKAAAAEAATATATATGETSAALAEEPVVETSSPDTVAADVCKSSYRLVSILIHTGTAMGGHYFAYSRPTEQFGHAQSLGLMCQGVDGSVVGNNGMQDWLELNDAGVREIKEEHAQALLAVLTAGPDGMPVKTGDGGAAAEGAAAEGAAADGAAAEGAAADSAAAEGAAAAGVNRRLVRPAAGVEGNAYMLLYARTDLVAVKAEATVGAAEPPAAVKAEVEAENAAWGRLKRAFEVRCKLCRFEVQWPPVANGDVGSLTTGVAAAVDAAASLVSSGAQPPSAARASSTGAESTSTSASSHAAPPMLTPDSGAIGGFMTGIEAVPSATGVEVAEFEEALRVESRSSSKATSAAASEAITDDTTAKNGSAAVVDAPCTWKLSEALDAVVSAVGEGADVSEACGVQDLTLKAAADRGLVRLRKWEKQAERPTAILGQDPDRPHDETTDTDPLLSTMGLGAGCSVCVELRHEDEEWAVYDPHAMVLRIVRWLPAIAGGAGGEGGLKLEERLSLMPCDTIIVSGGKSATAAGLAVEIASSSLGVPATLQTLWFADGDLLHRADPQSRDVINAGGDEAKLYNLGLVPGTTVVVEVMAAGDDETTSAAATATATGAGAVMASPASFKASFDAEASIIEVQFNLPAGDRPSEGAASAALDEPIHTDYSQRVLMSKRQTLAELKDFIAGALGDGVESEEFHLTRNARSTEQLKQLGVILGDSKPARRGRAAVAGLGLVDGSIVHVRWGRQLLEDETTVDFVWYEPTSKRRFERICALPIRDASTVLAVKRMLRDALLQKHSVELAQAKDKGETLPPPPPPVQRLRLRDKTKSEAGKILRDPQRLKSAIPRLTDGYEIAVQRLAEPETVGPGDMIVATRRWNPRTFKLTPVTELVVDKKLTLRDIRQVVARKFGIRVHADADPPTDVAPAAEAAASSTPSAQAGSTNAAWAVSIAKHTQFAKPLRGASAGSDLTWLVAPEMHGWSSAREGGKDVREADAQAQAAAAASATVAADVAKELEAALAIAAAAAPTTEELEAAAVAFGTAGTTTSIDALPTAAATRGKAAGSSEAAASRRVVESSDTRPLHEIEADLDEESVAIVAKPLALRNGVTVVVRDERIKHKADADGIKPPVAATGGRAGAGRASRKPWQRGGAGAGAGGGARRPERGIHFRQGANSSPQEQARKWSCGVCTFEQTNAASSCEMCGAPQQQ